MKVYPLLLTLALLLPFELSRPLFFVGPLGITSVELPLYALVALSFARREAWHPSAWAPVHWAALAWVAAHLASAAAAEGDRSLALRFALRASAGALLVFPVSAVVRTPGRAAPVLRALVAGAVLSAAMGVAEAFVPGAAWLCAPFKTVTARVGDTLRAGGPFQYPNPGALYWGAAMPPLIALASSVAVSARSSLRLVTAGSAFLLATAVAATGSRGGLLATAMALGVLAAFPALNLRRAAAWALAGLVAAVVAVGLAHPSLVVRDSGLHELPWFAGRFELVGSAPEIEAGNEARLAVRARNVGALDWEATGPMPMGIGAQWLDAAGRIVREEPATPLAATVPSRAAAVLDVRVTAPGGPGRYRLRFEIVGGGTSFVGPGTARDEAVITVVGSPAPEGDVRPALRPTQRPAIRPELWRAGLSMWQARPLLGVGPDNFRRLYAAQLGPRRLDERVNANSLYVETLAGLGLVGACSLGFLLATLAVATRRAWRLVPLRERPFVVASGAALLAFALHGVVDSVLAATPLFGLFWVHAGMIAGLSNGRNGTGRPT